MTQPIPGPREQTPEWLALHDTYDPSRERPVVFGASQAAAACGQSKYQTPLDLYMLYRGLKPPVEFPEATQKRLRRGRALQPVILGEYAAETGIECYAPEMMFFHGGFGFMGASPDAITTQYDFETSHLGRVIEIKASDPRMFAKEGADDHQYGPEGTDWVPNEVLFQAQQQMAVMDVPRCDVVVFFGLFVMRIYPIVRNDTIIEAIVAGERELAERIVNEDPPEPNWSHPNTRRLLSELYGYRAGEGVSLAAEHAEMALANAVDKAQIKRLQAEIEGRNNRLLAALEGAEYGDLPNGRRIKRIKVAAHVVPSYECPGYEYIRETKGK